MSDERDETMRDETMRELAELYALGGLEPDERAAVEKYLAGEGCRAALARGRLVAYALATSVAEQPPAGLRQRILAGAKARQSPPASATLPGAMTAPGTTSLRPRFWMQPAWLAAAAAVVVVVFAATWAIESARHAGATWAAACTASTPLCPANSRVIAAGPATLRLEAHGMPAPPAGKVYQAWYIRPGASPTPAPVFVPDANGDASVELPIGAEKGLTVAVTVEPPGGSKAPTTKPFLVASIN
jgi:anti-sigma-K factor RskA